MTPDQSDREIDYLVCKECQSPCYIFETDGGRILEAQCQVCGNEDTMRFAIGEIEED
jgi:translation initiation factor 2 beta subunit (eIF-2beta)/eIF-5